MFLRFLKYLFVHSSFLLHLAVSIIVNCARWSDILVSIFPEVVELFKSLRKLKKKIRKGNGLYCQRL